ncbi:MAG: transcriptional regulator NrdR [Omnitrophica bacterium RBG_13_46_9]|nr:MAG: transcriptional regulator NrdR [Omnitrophica bacterium RBG_13_46_9]
MKCPYCRSKRDKVVDSRTIRSSQSIRRRRECLRCHKRYTTYEYVEKIPVMVIKSDGRREAFDRKKILNGLIKACEKRPISLERLENIVARIESQLQNKFLKEIKSKVIGEMVMAHLRKLDEIAYVRFASVYRQFRDVSQFMKELNKFLK